MAASGERAMAKRTGSRKAGAAAKTEPVGSSEPPLDPQLLRRVVVENINPQVDGGRFPIKRVTGESVTVSADIHADGHDLLAAVVMYRRAGDAAWREVPMTLV